MIWSIAWSGVGTAKSPRAVSFVVGGSVNSLKMISGVVTPISDDKPLEVFVSTANGVDGDAENATTKSACRAFVVSSVGRKLAAKVPDEKTDT